MILMLDTFPSRGARMWLSHKESRGDESLGSKCMEKALLLMDTSSPLPTDLGLLEHWGHGGWYGLLTPDRPGIARS